jgi:dUTP pyrophosphatase
MGKRKVSFFPHFGIIFAKGIVYKRLITKLSVLFFLHNGMEQNKNRGIVMEYKVKIKLINDEAKLPYRANEGDAGLDLFSIEEKIIKAGESELIRTGIQMELPEGTEAQIRPRSGLALKHSITVLNSPGTIDEGYRGEIKVILINHGKEDFKVEKQMRIAQMVITPVIQVKLERTEVLSNTERDKGGFGSSGE